jgi:hypothetical protein
MYENQKPNYFIDAAKLHSSKGPATLVDEFYLSDPARE